MGETGCYRNRLWWSELNWLRMGSIN